MSFQIDFPAQPRFPIISPNLTVTASAPILQLSQTWNNAGVTFTGATLNIVPTASASGSKYFEVQRDGIPMLDLQSGSGGNTSLVMRQPSGTIRFSLSSASGNSALQLLNSSGAGVTMTDEGAHVLALRNSTNAQTFRVYNTYTDASNYERGFVRWNTNSFEVGTEKAGTGSARAFGLVTDGSVRWYIGSTSGHFLADTDNTYDIGAAGANRPRAIYVAGTATIGGNVFAAGDVRAGASGSIYWNGSSVIRSISDGVLALYNSATTDFSRLQFGGTTSSFPALKRSSTVLQARLADDSDFAPLQGKLRTQANAVAETPTATHTMIITDAGGTAYRVLCVV